MAALISYPATDIPLEGVAVELELPIPWLTATLADAGLQGQPGSEAGTFSGRLSRSGQDIVVRGHAKARLDLPCVRCLEPAAVTVDAELSLLLQPQSRSATRSASRKGGNRQAGAGAEYEFSSDEATEDVYDGETVVLDPFIREALLLEIPTFPLCAESCPGIATADSVPGALPKGDNGEVDPRLAPLGAFRDEPGGPVTIDQLVDASRARSSALGRKPVLQANRQGSIRSKRGKK